MARVIAVSLEGVESTFGFASVDRSALYGRRRRVPLDEHGNACTRASILDDGSLLLRSGMTGQGYEFQVITVVVLGGTALTGGNGNLFGAFFAALFITYLQNGLGLMQVNSYWQYVATGMVLIMAISINRLKSTILGQREA